MHPIRTSRRLLALAVATAGALSACGRSAADASARAGDLPVDADFAKKLQGQLLDARPGAVIEIPAKAA